MRLWVLGSGSRGNALLLEEGDVRVLVDAGFPARVMAKRLECIGVAPASVSAVLLTHEHHDHVRGAAAGARLWGWTVHATRGTIAANDDVRALTPSVLSRGASVEVGSFHVDTVPVSHDAAEPVALVITSRRTGCRCGIAYDLGRVGTQLRARMRDLDLLVLEANHDRAMLRCGPYPVVVQDRIGGPNGHLCNDGAAELAREVAHGGLRHVVLAHLSENCNQPALAMDAMRARLTGSRFRGRVQLTWQDKVVGPIEPTSRATVQLALPL